MAQHDKSGQTFRLLDLSPDFSTIVIHKETVALPFFHTLDFEEVKAQGVSCLFLLHSQFWPLSEVRRLSVNGLKQSNLSFDHKPQI